MITGVLTDRLITAQRKLEEQHRVIQGAAWQAYDGDHPDSLTVPDDAPNDNMKLNYPRLLVQANVMALFGKEPEFSINGESEQPDDDPGSNPLLAAFEAWEDDQGLLATLQKLALTGGVCGTAVYKIQVGEPGAMPRVKVLDPSRVMIFTDPDDVEDVWAFLIQWRTLSLTGDVVWRRQIIERTTMTSWNIRDEESDAENGRWRPRAEPINWAYPWPPIGYCQNLPETRHVYGLPDIPPDTIGLAYDLNRIASNTNKIIRIHAHPKLVGTGFDADSVKMAPDQMVTLPNPEAKISAIEMSSDLGSSIRFYELTLDAYHEVNRLPAVATGKLDSTGQLSGVALSILYGPLVQQTEQKRLSYGPMVEEMICRVMELAGFPDPEVDITWQEVIPNDPLQERQIAQIDATLGVSDSTLMTNLGYDAAKESAQKADETTASLDAQQRAMSQGNVSDMFQPPPGG